MDSTNPSVFLDSRRLCSDNCAAEARDVQNDHIEHYALYQYLPVDCHAPDARFPEFSYDHINLTGRIGYGLAEGCTVDSYSHLRNDPAQLTRDKCRIQLFSRIFTGGPNLRPGIGDPSKELDILAGSDSSDITGSAGCKRAITELQTYNMTPMLDCIKPVQDPKHIVEDWKRGGAPTRDLIRRKEWLEQCDTMTFGRHSCPKQMH